MLVTKQLTLAIDFHCVFHTMAINGYRQQFGYQQSSKYLLCSIEEILQVWTTRVWVNDDNVSFWVNSLLISKSTLISNNQADYKIKHSKIIWPHNQWCRLWLYWLYHLKWFTQLKPFSWINILCWTYNNISINDDWFSVSQNMTKFHVK